MQKFLTGIQVFYRHLDLKIQEITFLLTSLYRNVKFSHNSTLQFFLLYAVFIQKTSKRNTENHLFQRHPCRVVKKNFSTNSIKIIRPVDIWPNYNSVDLKTTKKLKTKHPNLSKKFKSTLVHIYTPPLTTYKKNFSKNNFHDF